MKVVDESIINYEAISSLLDYITVNFEEGAILVFLPGLAEITKMLEALAGNPLFNDKVRTYICKISQAVLCLDIPPTTCMLDIDGFFIVLNETEQSKVGLLFGDNKVA